MNSLKEMVADNKRATFSYYRSGELIYQTECGFEFPIPISDTGDGVFHNTEKAILLMRWIRLHMDVMAAIKKSA